MNNNLHPSLD